MTGEMIAFRQWNQARRIQHGIDNGSLSEREVGTLRNQQQQISAAVDKARADGQLSGAERREIRGLQHQASQDIFLAKHNEEGATPRCPGYPPPPSSPNGDTARADRREARQATRIENGIKQGDLTLHEARRLVAQQGGIHRAEARFKADGVVTDQERAALERRQDWASASIFLARHNGVRQS